MQTQAALSHVPSNSQENDSSGTVSSMCRVVWHREKRAGVEGGVQEAPWPTLGVLYAGDELKSLTWGLPTILQPRVSSFSRGAWSS